VDPHSSVPKAKCYWANWKETGEKGIKIKKCIVSGIEKS